MPALGSSRPTIGPAGTPSFAHLLLGRTLPGGWTVVEQLKPGDFATGSNFSVNYVVKDATGRRAFLKTLNLTRALLSADPARELEFLTRAFKG